MTDNWLWNLKNLRKKKGFTQEELAQKLGITKQTISTYENGSSFPSLNVLAQLPKVLEVEPEELFGFLRASKYKILEQLYHKKGQIRAEEETKKYEYFQYCFDGNNEEADSVMSLIEKTIIDELKKSINIDNMTIDELYQLHDFICDSKINELLKMIEHEEQQDYKEWLLRELDKPKN